VKVEHTEIIKLNSSKFKTFSINPLMPELNHSEQGCLPEFFTAVFKCYCLLLEKKAYLIDFSFKFHEIKFCTLLMNNFGKNIHLFL